MPRGVAPSFLPAETVLLGVALSQGGHLVTLEFSSSWIDITIPLVGSSPSSPFPAFHLHVDSPSQRKSQRKYLFSSQISSCALVCSPVTSRSPKASNPATGSSGSTFRLSYRPLESYVMSDEALCVETLVCSTMIHGDTVIDREINSIMTGRAHDEG